MRLRAGWIRVTVLQLSHFALPSTAISVLFDFPQSRQCQSRSTYFMTARFLAEGRRREVKLLDDPSEESEKGSLSHGEKRPPKRESFEDFRWVVSRYWSV